MSNFRNYCRDQGINYGIFYADADTRENAAKQVSEARKHYQEVYEEAREGLKIDSERKFIPMIPLKMIENWLLADDAAFESIFGKAPRLPKKPELIWGDKHDPGSGYPKNVLA